MIDTAVSVVYSLSMSYTPVSKFSLPWATVLSRAEAIHAGKGYAYAEPLGGFKNMRQKLTIVCPEHGEFYQQVQAHLKGQSCPKCSKLRASRKISLSWPDFLERAATAHPERGYIYEEPVGGKQGGKHKLRITCPVHGLFLQTPETHLAGKYGCPQCAREAVADALRYGLEQTAEVSLAPHPGKYELITTPENFGGFQEKLELHCSCQRKDGSVHGSFTALPTNLSRGKGCPACVGRISKAELEIDEFIRSLGLHTIRARGRDLPGLGQQELDIYVPDRAVAVEHNGLIWHSERFKKNRNYHREKSDLAASLGVKLIHIFEDEWLGKQDIVKSRLRMALGFCSDRIFARNTRVVLLNHTEASSFLKHTHLQGPGTPAKVRLGLQHQGRVIAVATYGKARYGNAGWELLRYASEGQVIGGASKLLAYFRKNFSKPGEQLISFANRCWGEGNLYSRLGFTYEGITPPNYSYVKGSARYSRERFQKHKLAKLFESFDPKLTEVQNCWNNGYYRVFDCGNSKWSLIL